MTIRQPPRPAAWLLVRLGSDVRIEALIGDLAEEFAGGRSSFWYWRQTIGVLGLNLRRVLRTHALSFTAAVLAGCAANSLWRLGSDYAFRPVYANLGSVARHPWTVEGLIRIAGMQLNVLSNTVLSFVSVWLVTRVHRAHRRGVLVAFVAAVTIHRLPDIARLFVDAAAHPRVPLPWAPVIVPTGLQATFTLAVGLWMIHGERPADMDRPTRLAVILVYALAAIVALIYHARLVGALPFSRPEWNALDALDIAGVAYLSLLWWRPKRSPALCRGAR